MQQIIYLEVDDDLPAIRDRLEWAQARRVMLVVPTRCATLRSLVNLRVLKRYAQHLALDVALVTRDPETRRLAKSEGFPVLGSTGRGRLLRWRRSVLRRSRVGADAVVRHEDEWAYREQAAVRRGRTRTGSGGPAVAGTWAQRLVGLIISLAMLAVLVGAALVLLPEATVVLTPYSEPVGIQLELHANPQAESNSLSKAEIPARFVEVEVEDEAQVPTVSKKDAPDAPAVGTVVFANLTNAPVEVPISTTLRTGSGLSVRFLTTTSATLPAQIGATATADIVALEAGLSGLVGAATINVVEDPVLTRQLRVTNDQPTRGASVKQVGVVTQADKERLKSALLQQLQQRAFADLQGRLEPGEVLPAESLVAEVLAEDYDQFVGSEADNLTLRMRLWAAGTAYSNEQARTLAYEALRLQVPEGYTLDADSLEFEVSDVKRMDGRQPVFEATAQGRVVTGLETGSVRDLIAGQTAEDAEAALAQNLLLGAPPEVHVGPAWLFDRFPWLERWPLMGRVPLLPFRIRVLTAGSS
jgi:hypothetical protein